MNLGEIKTELELHVRDAQLSAYFTTWTNDAVYEIANDFSLPALKLEEPTTKTVTESAWLYDMPNTYMKNLYKCYDSDWNKITIKRDLGDIDTIDIDHDETGDNVTTVAVRNSRLGIYPMAAETINLWFYKKPTDLVDDEDEPDCIPKQYHRRVIIPKVVVLNYQLLLDMTVNPPHKSLQWWTDKYHAGLYGDGSDIGMINCFARDKKPKRHGGKNPLP